MKKNTVVFFCLILLILLAGQAYSQSSNPEEDRVLTSAETIFKMMHLKNYKGIWDCLTEKSKQRIVDDTFKDILKISKENKKFVTYTKDMVFNDFEAAGTIAKEYWDAFLDNFDPVTVLEQSTWKMGKIEPNYAEVIIHYRKSERPAILQMFKEKGIWKTGLVETFWTSIR